MFAWVGGLSWGLGDEVGGMNMLFISHEQFYHVHILD